jgi:uncharacterized membrane protein YbaN (DUF454 family)
VEEIMKTFVFQRESNNFDDVLKDKNIKKYIVEKYKFAEHLIIRVKDTPEAMAYITLMFSEELVSMRNLIPDRTPKPYLDYTPKRK